MLLLNNMNNEGFLSANLDFLGFSASIACALHCATIPLVLTLSSISNLGFLENPLLEGGILLLGAIIALLSLLPGYYKKHHKISPLILIVTGFMIILGGKFQDQALHEGIFTAIGAALVAAAHYSNWKLSKKAVPLKTR